LTHSAKIIADSVSPDGVRLTTIECVYPRIIHAEMMTHRVFSRNAASSRAIPVEKMIRMVEENPYIPTHWGKNQKGMQADEELSIEHQKAATVEWLHARDEAIYRAQKILTIGVHKQITNRLLEPFLWYTCIITFTEWTNFSNLRCNKHAHPEIKLAAELMRDAMGKSEPKALGYGDWHLPYVHDEDFEQVILADPTHPMLVQERLCKVSVGCCARVSYLTHDGKRDPAEDIALADRLLVAGHMSPFEHVARPMEEKDAKVVDVEKITNGCSRTELLANTFCGNFRGWVSFRKMIPGEGDILGKNS
jgi:thymidylate synthase ThyX